MAKFCTKCGRPLEEGAICNCETTQNAQVAAQTTQEVAPTPAQQTTQQTTQQATQQAPQQTVAKVNGFDFNLYFKTVLDTFVGITKKPVTAGIDFIAKADLSIALFFIALQAIFTGLFSMVVCSKIGAAISTLGSLTSLVSGSSSKDNDVLDLIKMPYFKGFILTVLISIILTGILALVLFGANKVLKNIVTINQMVAAASLRSVFAVFTSLFAIIIFFINPTIGVLFFFAGNLVGVILIVMTLPKNAATENLVPIVMGVAFVIFMIVSLFIMSKCWTIYVPSAIKEGIDGLKDLISDPTEIMESIF